MASGNIYWRDIPAGAKVVLVGKPRAQSYVAVVGRKRYSVYWMGDDAREAQKWLDRRVEQKKYKAGRVEILARNKAAREGRSPRRRTHHGDLVISSRSTGYLHGRTRRVRAVVGQRVEMSPGTDHWMRGDRYGVIVGIRKKDGYAKVLMDRSGRTLTVYPRLLRPV